ncbi:class I SAM-dependent DNA methyltransferase [Virgibacillus sp. W0181]|uniref:class I SAM-dependent DNA methyltransferase n=1 Tax=Virgibacillus sp. W0181 TaxID=3391581 RepID=UPI003F46C911
MTYHEMASLYDQLMAHVPYSRWTTFTKEIIEKSGKKVQTIADLGCGTGSITTALAKEGFKMTGIDASGDMLTYAEQKASVNNVSIDWIMQDLRDLQGLSNLDAAVSYCDVINYVTSEAELRKTFLHINHSLKPGGLFIFDVHDLEYIENYYIGSTFADVEEEVSYIWFCLEGEEPGEMFHELTFFRKVNGVYERFDEIHHQKTYPISFYIQLLEESGFTNINFYRDFAVKSKQQEDQTERIFFSAEKRLG